MGAFSLIVVINLLNRLVMSHDEESYSFYSLPKDDEIDLQVGFPEPDSIPIKEIEECFVQFFKEKRSKTDFFQYGHFAGYPKIRDYVADFLTRFYGLTPEQHISKDNIIICGGVSFGLDSLLTVLGIDETRIVYCEEMTYFCMLDLLKERKCQVRSIPFTDQGTLDLDWLEQELQMDPDTAEKTALVYTIPTFQNPCGALMADANREQLVRLAHKYDFYIASDEVYHTLAFSAMKGKMPTSMALLDDVNNGRVMSLGSVSKVVSPALRFGWIHTSTALFDRLQNAGALVSGSCVCHLTCGAMEVMFRQNIIEELIRRAANSLEQKAKVFYEALKAHLPQSCSLNSFNRSSPSEAPIGGYFMLIQMPMGLSSTTVAEVCEQKYKLKVKASSTCGDSRTDRLRLCFAFHKESELVEAAKRIGNAVLELTEN